MVSQRVESTRRDKGNLVSKRAEVVILAGFCLLSLMLGLVAGRGAHNMGIALFFYLLSACFFLAMFRPHSL
jgi:4-amino-4-deoxy-L-arabinose transferase-like glycosyltransferase